MTFQEPNELRNDSDVDLAMLRAYFFCDIDGNNASDTAYLPVQPRFPTPNERCTSLWRGFIATLHLYRNGSLELVRFEFPYSSAKPKPQFVNERFTGDFSVLFRPFFSGPNTIVPFRSGVILSDRSEWFIDDQTMSAFVDDVFRDSGLRVTDCDLPGFMPRSCLPQRMRDCMHELIGSKIACRLLRCDDRHPAVYIAAEIEDGG